MAEEYLSGRDLNLIKTAYEFAAQAHDGQLRNSGEPYIIHPLAVAHTLVSLHLDAPSIAAAFLHDVPDDTPRTIDDIKRQFGPEVAGLVSGVSKLGKVRIKKNWLRFLKKEQETNFDRHIENLRKMFMAMSQDIRVIIIKLADRLHNMQTLEFLPKEKQQRIAKETLEIYAPLANRLGMGEFKGQLEDLAFPYIYPEEYHQLLSQIKEEFAVRQRYIERVKKELAKELVKNKIEILKIDGRVKHYYSLYQKLFRHDNELEKIYDLVALRVIVKTIEDCYKVLGIVHKKWRPLPGRIKDYIALPKPNGYQSLHTTVFCLDGKITEIQIRTGEMHDLAEYGIAAHWYYKEGGDKVGSKNKLRWIQELADWQRMIKDPEEWKKTLKLDFFENRIFVFTPQGDVHDLPQGATPVDFAFAVHSEIGRRCNGTKVNGKIATLDYPLQNGDIVEIVINKKSTGPKRDWLAFVKTNRAKELIKKSLKLH